MDLERKPYYLSDLLNEKKTNNKVILEGKTFLYEKSDMEKFKQLCDNVKQYFISLELDDDDLERQKRAIIGYSEDVSYYKNKIEEYLKINNLQELYFPEWYSDICDAIFHELWGLAGIAEWYSSDKKYLIESSSAKIIGEKIYFSINDRTVLMPQKIGADRRKQLRRALLSNDYRVRLDNVVPDIEMVTGERIKIFSEEITRKDMDTIIFRKFPIREYTFEKQIELGTYPKECVKLFKAIAGIGYNMTFTGAVRTGKTTHLSTWLSYEDKNLEGLIVETRPEIPVNDILPGAPVMQLVVDTEEKLADIRASIMRSDADYVIMAEARDAYAFDIALKCASIGTRRCKLTAHVNSPYDLPYEFAKEITRIFGGDINYEAISIAKSYTINMHFINKPGNKSKKRLEGIYVYDYNHMTYEIYIHTLCKYDIHKDSWCFNNCITDNMKTIGLEQSYSDLSVMETELERLSLLYPMCEKDRLPIKPFYSR